MWATNWRRGAKGENGSPSCATESKTGTVVYLSRDAGKNRPTPPKSADKVPIDSAYGTKKNGPPEGDPLSPSSLSARQKARDLASAFRKIRQARASVRALMRAHRHLADLAIIGGDAFAAVRADRETHARLYREGFAVYEAGHAAGPDFETLSGVEFEALERALEAMGWLLADPATRARLGSSRYFSVGPDGLVAHG